METQPPRGISELDYRRLSELIRSQWGIVLSSAKRTMVEARLMKRTQAVGLDSISAYCRYLHSAEGMRVESPHLIDSITTHKTDFFREPSHFDYLVDGIVPELQRGGEAGIRRPLWVWSSACSTGEEPYTLAMVLSDYAGSQHSLSLRFEILGTDISPMVLETARTAIYPETAVAPVPQAFRRSYLLRGKGQNRKVVRIAPQIRSRVNFRQLNLLDVDYRLPGPMDVIFCRNVMIYFDRVTQEKILSRICAQLGSGGYLVMGHSESLHGLTLPVAQVNATVYRRLDG